MIDVSCAIIVQNGRILAVQRGPGRHLAGKWEFPGGKVQGGETPEDSVAREVREELGLDIQVQEPLSPVTHAYSDKTVRLIPFLCRITGGSLLLHEHQASRWLLPGDLPSFDWCEADAPILRELGERLQDSRDAGPCG